MEARVRQETEVAEAGVVSGAALSAALSASSAASSASSASSAALSALSASSAASSASSGSWLRSGSGPGCLLIGGSYYWLVVW